MLTIMFLQTNVPPASAPAAAPATKTTSPRATPAPAASDPPTLATARELRLAPARRLSLRRISLPRLRLGKFDIFFFYSLGFLLLACYGSGVWERKCMGTMAFLAEFVHQQWMDGWMNRRIDEGFNPPFFLFLSFKYDS
jgi:hypothetical protein